MNYHIARNGQQLGVMTEDQIQQDLANGTLVATDMGWTEGMEGWKPLSELFSGSATPAPSYAAPMQGMSYGAPQTSGLSIAALVCGILSFVTCGATGLPAIICGHLALSKIKGSNGAIGGKGMALAGLVMGYLFVAITVVAIVASLALPAFSKVQEKSLQVKSISNARQIILSCKIYAAAHSGKYPKELSELVESDIIPDGKIFHDPLLHDNEQIGYDYFGAGMTDSDPGGKVLLLSKWSDRLGKKVVGLNDGSVSLAVPPQR